VPHHLLQLGAILNRETNDMLLAGHGGNLLHGTFDDSP
jgi:hypothetical protein